jgi:uncharacterized RDD family membrane protein YckC
VNPTVPAHKRGSESIRRWAGVPSRLLAVVLDLVILSAVFFPVTRMVKGTWIMAPADHRWMRGWWITDPLCLAFLAAMFAYFLLFEGLLGATPGKRMTGLRVTGPHGEPPGVVRSAVRNLLRVVDGLPALGILGAVLISSSDERTRFGDRAAGTRVIHVRQNRQNPEPTRQSG